MIMKNLTVKKIGIWTNFKTRASGCWAYFPIKEYNLFLFIFSLFKVKMDVYIVWGVGLLSVRFIFKFKVILKQKNEFNLIDDRIYKYACISGNNFFFSIRMNYQIWSLWIDVTTKYVYLNDETRKKSVLK